MEVNEINNRYIQQNPTQILPKPLTVDNNMIKYYSKLKYILK